MSINPTTGDRIAQLRSERGWTISQLSRYVKTNVKSVREWEENISCPSAQNIVKLCKLFSTTSDYLLCIDDTPTVRLDGLSSNDITRARKLVQVLVDTSQVELSDR